MYYLIDINNVVGNDKNAKGEAIKQKFRAYNSMDDYAKDKVQFLKKLYDFDENDDIATFTSKLTGANKGKRRYAEAKNYNTLLTNVYNKIAKGQEGLKINWKPDRPSVDVAKTVKEYGPSFASMILTGNPSSFINKILGGTTDSPRRVNFEKYLKDPKYSKRKFLVDNMNALQDSLIGRNYNEPQRLAFLASVGDESGGDSKSVDSTGEFKGIIQWGSDRYSGTEDLGEQIHYMLNEAETLKDPGWNNGGKGIPTTPTAKFAYDSFWKSATPDSATLYLNKGYVRPREEHDRVRRAEQASIMNKYLEKKRRGGVIKYQEPAQGINRSAIRTDEDRKVPKYNRAVYSSVNPIWGIPNSIIQAGRLSTQARIKSWRDDQDNMEYSVGTQIGDSVADAAWRKRLGLSYDSKFLPKFNGDTVRLPKQLEMEIPTDTNMLKKRIANTERLMKRSSKYKNSTAVNVALKSDQRALKALRDTYKTGKAVGLDEYSNNSRQLVENGEINEEYISPLNVFRNYNIRYDKDTDKMYYSKSYDFDTVEHNWDKFVPGTKFYIRGFVDLNKK